MGVFGAQAVPFMDSLLLPLKSDFENRYKTVYSPASPC